MSNICPYHQYQISKLPADLIQLDSHSSTHFPEHCSDMEKYQVVIICFSMSVVCSAASYAPKNWSMKWTQNGSPSARDWFESTSWPFKALQSSYSKTINDLILSKILISEISILAVFCAQLRQCLNVFVIFLRIPHDGMLRPGQFANLQLARYPIMWNLV